MSIEALLDRQKRLQAQIMAREQEISSPEALADPKELRRLSQTLFELKPVLEAVENLIRLEKVVSENQDMADDGGLDEEMRAMAREELPGLKADLEAAREHLLNLDTPQDPDNERGAIIEIRAGTGGEEAALFGQELYRMYSRYAESKGWRVEVMSLNDTELGGVKEIVFCIKGQGVWRAFKFESGTHRVQRVPTTESGGRIHTSAVTVAVLPEAGEDEDIVIRTQDLRVDTYRASGAGGQHVNKTESAIRITHIPSGIVVACQEERSQMQNREKAMTMLRSYLRRYAIETAARERSEMRKNQVGSGDRSEKIRTYNYPQNRLSDHRINLTLYNLDRILEGDFDPVVEPLIKNELEEARANL